MIPSRRSRNPRQVRTIEDVALAAPIRRMTPEQVFRAYAEPVYSLARRMIGGDLEATEVTQEVLLQAVRNLSDFRGVAQLNDWLRRSTVNAVLAHRARTRLVRRRLPVEQKTIAEIRQVFSAHRDPCPLNEAITRVVEEAVAGLPSEYRDVLVLADIEQLPNVETAGLLGLSLPVMKLRLHKARLMLCEVLSPHSKEIAS